MMNSRQCTVEIVPEKRFPEIMNAAKAGGDELRETVARRKRYRDADKKHEFSQFGGEMAQLGTASDPEEFSRAVVRGYGQALGLLLNHGIAALREKYAETRMSAEVAAGDAPGLKLELKEEAEKSARRIIAKQRREQPSGMKEPSIENTAARPKKTPQPARVPKPTLGPIPKPGR
jgi:hypothetical protein